METQYEVDVRKWVLTFWPGLSRLKKNLIVLEAVICDSCEGYPDRGFSVLFPQL